RARRSLRDRYGSTRLRLLLARARQGGDGLLEPVEPLARGDHDDGLAVALVVDGPALRRREALALSQWSRRDGVLDAELLIGEEGVDRSGQVLVQDVDPGR